MRLLLACCACWLVAAAHAQIKPGEYVMNPGYGVLHIQPDKGGALKFEISVRGTNFHVCGLEGVIRNGEARLEDSADPKQPCVVSFDANKTGIAVTSRYGRTCSFYCGARAWFEGQYATPPAGCGPHQVADTRRRFKAAFDRKAFNEARALLAPVVNRCIKTLDHYEEGWVLNDFALTQQRLGDNAGCQATLQPWLDLAQKADEQIKGDYPPSDADAMLRLAVATRTNMRLCGAPVRTKPPERP
jgi:hypothetical protein